MMLRRLLILCDSHGSVHMLWAWTTPPSLCVRHTRHTMSEPQPRPSPMLHNTRLLDSCSRVLGPEHLLPPPEDRLPAVVEQLLRRYVHVVVQRLQQVLLQHLNTQRSPARQTAGLCLRSADDRRHYPSNPSLARRVIRSGTGSPHYTTVPAGEAIVLVAESSVNKTDLELVDIQPTDPTELVVAPRLRP